MHREAATERLADPRQFDRSAQPAPPVMVHQDDLLGAQAHTARQILERGGTHICRQRDIHGTRDGGHLLLAAHRVLVVLQHPLHSAPPADGRLHRPDAIRVDAQGNIRPKGLAQGEDRADLDLRLQGPGFEFKRRKAVLRAHRLGLRDDARGIERLGLARGSPAGGIGGDREAQAPACTAMLEEQIRCERHPLAHLAAQQIHHRAPDGFADNIQASDLDSAKDARRAPPIPAIRAAGEALGQRQAERRELERVASDHHLARGLQIGGDRRAAGDLAQAGNVIVGHQLDDRAQRIGGVQAGSVAQRRVGDRDRRDMHLTNTHTWLLLTPGYQSTAAPSSG